MNLNLSYERKNHNKICVCDKNNLVLGEITKSVFGGISFTAHRATSITEQHEIQSVCQMLQRFCEMV